MRNILFLISLSCLILACFAFVACDKEQVGASVEQAGQIAADAGTALGLGWLGTIGAVLSGIGALIAGKKAGVGQRYAEGGWSRDETAELVKALREHGYTIQGPV